MKNQFTRLASRSGALLLAMSMLSILPAQAALSTTATISQGQSGAQVSELQTDLKALSYFTCPTVTGYFGTVTSAAVESYQTAYQLPVNGAVDATTATSINHAMVKEQIVADSWKYEYTPYKYGGSSPTSGFDCSGFVYYMFNTHGVTSVPRTTSATLATMGQSIDRAHLEPGDLVFFSLAGNGVVSHVGIYIGNNEFMSATSSKGVYPQSLTNTYWAPKYTGAKRIY